MRDDLVFDKMTTDEVVVSKATQSIVKELNCMEISWTDQQKKRLKDKIENAVKKNPRRGNYKDFLLRQCKNHGGSVGSTGCSEISKRNFQQEEIKILPSISVSIQVSQQKTGHLNLKKTGKTREILVQKTGIQDRILNLNIQKSWNSQLPNVVFGAKEYQTTYRPHGCLKLYRVWGKRVSNN